MDPEIAGFRGPSRLSSCGRSKDNNVHNALNQLRDFLGRNFANKLIEAVEAA